MHPYTLISIILVLAVGFSGQNLIDLLIGLEFSDLGISAWKVVFHKTNYMLLGMLVGAIIMAELIQRDVRLRVRGP